jgi:3-oxoacyl-[acyl-carrier-protein] synthase III
MSAETARVGQHAKTSGARVAGIVSCVPERIVDNQHFVACLGETSVAEVTKMIGVQTRRWVEPDVSTSDMCLKAAQTLLDTLGWAKDSVDGLLFVSQTPDYRLPATACALHGRLGLRPGVIAFDVNLGCSGYPYALWLAMTMVQSGAVNRILLAVGDTISRTVDPDDRATALLFGDAGTVTAIERCDPSDSTSVANFVLGTDGSGASNLVIPRGGFKDDSLIGDERLQSHKPDTLFMDGGEVFNFTLRAVPRLIAACIETAETDIQAYDAFLFHQANLFMIKHLVKKAKLPMEKVPVNIDRYGNCSSASIPLLMTTELAQRLRTSSMRVAMFGFGVGYSWSSASLHLGPLACIETIEL